MTTRRSLDELLDEARSGLDRVGPAGAQQAVDAGALLVDIRPIAQRFADGEIPGAVLIERNVLEWRLAPNSAHRIPELADDDQVVIVVCNEGYASSLAAATLQLVGLPNATDLDGGFVAWKAAGLPVRFIDSDPLTPDGTRDKTKTSHNATSDQGPSGSQAPHVPNPHIPDV